MKLLEENTGIKKAPMHSNEDPVELLPQNSYVIALISSASEGDYIWIESLKRDN